MSDHPSLRRELVFIDTAVQDWQVLADAVRLEVETYLLDPAGDELEQMTQIITSHRDLSAIHILSHGQPGGIVLGDRTLGSAALRRNKDLLKSWHVALSPGTDLLLYGCEVGKGDIGRMFVRIIAEMTGADVAASENKTGSIAGEGDWILERSFGIINARNMVIEEYQNTLSVVGTQVRLTAGGTPITSSVAVGSGVEHDLSDGSNNVDFDVDPVNSIITITLRNGATWDSNSFSAEFSGGNLDQITFVNLSFLSSAPNFMSYSASASGKTITFNVPVGQPGDGTIVFSFSSTINVDTSPPVFYIPPTTSNITTTGFNLTANVNEAGTIYYVVVADNSGDPSSTQVKNGQNSSGSAALKSGSQVVSSAPSSHTFTITGLSESTAYDIYLVAQDGVPNLMASPYKKEVTTLSSNTAPTLDNSKSPALAAVDEDASAPSNGSTAGSTLVSALIDKSGTDADGTLNNYNDTENNEAGLAIIGVSNQGTLYYSANGGTTWTLLTGTVSASSALLLNADANTRLFFKPAADVSGTISDAITFKAWDRSSGTNGASGVNTASGTAFSSATDTASIAVNPVNDAPTFTSEATLAAIDEDTLSPAGNTINALLSSLFSDPENSFAGVAIVGTGTIASQGKWQYSTDDGSNWYDIGSHTTSMSLLLEKYSKIRFLPNTDFNGAVNALTVYAVDDSDSTIFTYGSSQQTFDTTTDDNTSKVSAAGISLGTSVNSVNEAPLLALSSAGMPNYPSQLNPTANFTWESQDGYGHSVAIDGNVAVVGSPGSRSAFVFERMGNAWVLKARLTSSEYISRLGYSAAVSGNTIVLGGDDTVLVYEKPSGGWSSTSTYTAKLTSFDATGENDWFGHSVAISENTVVVGNSYADDNGTCSGSAYVYEKPSGGWNTTSNHTVKLVLSSSDGNEFDWFSTSIAVSGDAIAVGAQGDDDKGTDAGAVYLYTKPSGGWNTLTTHTAKLTAADGGLYDRFGSSVSISGDTVAVGAYTDNVCGSAYIFEKPSGGNWSDVTQIAKLTPSDGADFGKFGSSISISGDSVVVGAYGDDDKGTESGSAYLYKKPGGGWSNMTETRKFIASDGAADDYFGQSVAISGDTVVVGAYRDDEVGANSGSAYLFHHVQTVAYTENGADLGLDGELTVSDLDNANLSSATVQITGNLASGEDVLSVTNPSLLFNWNASTGTLTLAGNASLVDYQAALRTVAYRNTSENPNTSQRTVTWKVNDGTIDSATQIIWINVSAINDKPVLDSSKSPALAAVNEDIAAPANGSTTGSTLVSSLIDKGGTLNNFSDAENNEVGLALIGISNQGTLYYSINNGAIWNPVSDTISASSALLLQADSNTRLYFKPLANYFGTINDAITFKAWDRTSGTNGSSGVDTTIGTAFSVDTDTASLTVNTINDLPLLTLSNIGLPVVEKKLTPSMDSFWNPGDDSSSGVAIDGTVAVVGAHANNSASVFEKEGDAWVLKAYLTASGGNVNDHVGLSVAISGDTVVVGCYEAAYVYMKPSGGWRDMTQTAKLTASDGVYLDRFGTTVAVSGDTVVVGAYDADIDSAAHQGSVYVYVKPSGGNWSNMTETAKITASDGAADDQFGASVAILGDTLLVGSPLDDDKALNAGSVYVYTKPLGGWSVLTTHTAKFTASDGAVNDAFGRSVALSGDTVVVGALGDDDPVGGQNAGSVYVYTKPSGGWSTTSTYTSKLTASDGAKNDFFGSAVSVSGDLIAVGAYGAEINSATDQGSAYVYTKPAEGWSTTSTFTAKLIASDGDVEDYLGHSVAVSGYTAIVSANKRDNTKGSAYLFDSVQTIAYTENSAAMALDGDLTVSDVDSSHLSSATVQITGNFVSDQDVLSVTSPGDLNPSWNSATGTLTLTGSATVSGYQDALRTVAYNNTSENPNTTKRTVTLYVNDGAIDSATRTAWINILAVNDAPILDNSKNPTLAAVDEDTLPNNNSTTGSTLVSSLIDKGGTLNNFSDLDNENPGIAVIGVSSQSLIYYSTDNGASWHALSGTVSANSALLLNADGNTRLYFRPAQNFNGPIGEAITFKAWDRSSGTNGATGVDTTIGTAFSTATETASITVNAINDPPLLTMGDAIKLNPTTDSNWGSGDVYGSRVAINGNIAVVGAPMDESNKGSVYVWEKMGGVWALQARLTASDGAANCYFGASVAVLGDTVVIGSPMSNSFKGSVYVYVKPSGGWSTASAYTAKLTTTDSASYLFGWSVAISEGLIVVGSTADNGYAGSAFLYQKPIGGNWTTTSTFIFKLTAFDAAAGDEFGSSVSISGNTVVVGAAKNDDNGTDSGSAYVFGMSSGGSPYIAKLTSNDSAAGDEFGASVSISGDTVVVGAAKDDEKGTDSGSAYVYVKPSGQDWATTSTYTAKLAASDNTASDQFGAVVFISGENVIVGAPGDDGSKGSAYQYAKPSGGNWSSTSTYINRYSASDGAAGDQFGFSVALSGNTVLAGAYLDDNSRGSVYAFESTRTIAYTENGAALALNGEFTVSDVDSSLSSATIQITGNFASGDVLSVTSPGSLTPNWNATTGTLTLSGSATPAAYQAALRTVAYHNTSETPNTSQRTVSLRVNDGSDNSNSVMVTINVTAVNDVPQVALYSDWGTLKNQNKLIPTGNPNWGSNDAYGAVATDGAVAVVGATGDDYNKGSVYVYENTGGVWTLKARLTTSEGFGNDVFGCSVAVSGDTVVVGSIGDDSYKGSVFVYVKPSGGWVSTTAYTAKITAPDGDYSDYFGGSVSISGDTIIVGAYGDDNSNGLNSGAVYVYVKANGGWSTTSAYTAKLIPSDGAAGHSFGKSVALSGDTVVVGAIGDDEQGTGSGSAYIYVKPGEGWSAVSDYTAKLSAFDGAAYHQFGGSVSISGDTIAVGAPYNSERNTYGGAAYVYVKPNGGWISTAAYTAKFIPGDSVFRGMFGNSVSISGDTVAVGALGDDDKGGGSGSIYLYKKPNEGWSTNPAYTSKFTASDGAADDNLGSSVSLSGDTLVVGAWQDDEGGENSGAAYVTGIDNTVMTAIYTENGTSVLDVEFLVTDLDEILSSATVQITGNYADGEDVLSVTDPGSLTPNWNSTNGTLTLTGNATPTAYQAALRTVTYHNSSDNPNTSQRTLMVKVNDGITDSPSVTVNLGIIAVNDAPILDSNPNPTLTALNEDPTGNSGNSVAEIVVDNSITDADGSAVEAIAVTAVDNTHGRWQYSTDNGGSWNAFSTTIGQSINFESAARLLDGALAGSSTQKIRFIPNANYNGAATLSFRAWDKSSGMAGSVADTGSTGGSSAFSSASDTASITVNAINDAPQLALSPGWGVLKSQSKLNPTSNANWGAGDKYGSSVAMDGNTAVVGAEGDNSYRGSAYVYEKIGNVWTLQARLTASFQYVTQFGCSVSISGDTVVIGARGDNGNQGSAYVFVKPSGGWSNMTETARLTASDGAVSDWFGCSVSISGDTIVVGSSSGDDNGIVNSGSAYVYVKPSGGWSTTSTFTAKLSASDAATDDYFGWSVDISGDTVGVGACFENGNKGAVYLYVKPSGGNWNSMNESAKLSASDSAAWDWFGWSVSLSEDTVVVGARYDDVGSNSDQGSAYVFTKPSGGWSTTSTYSAKLTASDGASSDEFGYSVSVSKNTIVVGANKDDDGGADSGSAYVYTKPFGGWGSTSAYTAKLTSSDGAAGDQFGFSVAVLGGTVVIGAYNDDDGGTDSGSATMFESEKTVETIVYTENGTSVLDGEFTVTDVEETLSSATIQITGNYAASEDLLSVTDAGSLIPNWNATTGTLTLTGNTTPTAYQSALRTVAYHNSSDNPNTNQRTITLKVNDGNVDSATVAVQVNINAVNDAPTVTANTGLTLNEGASATVTHTNLRVNDFEQSATVLTYTLGATPAYGALAKSATTLSSGSTFTQDDIDNNRIAYTHNGSETTADSFVFTVNDGAGGSISSTSFNITVTPVNDAPVLEVNEQLDTQGAITRTITTAYLKACDVDNASTAITFTIGTVPSKGTLKLSNTALSTGSTFTEDDIEQNRITYTVTQVGSPTDSFTFTVSDGAGGNVGPATFNLKLNSPPNVAVNAGLILNEGATATIGQSVLQVTDLEQTASSLIFTVGTAPVYGTLAKSESALAAGSTFTHEDINNSMISYTHNGGETTSDTFTFTVSDGAGGSITTTAFNITVTPVNDAPTIAVNAGLTLNEGAAAVISPSLLQITDVEQSAAALTIALVTLPVNGSLSLSSTVLSVTSTFTQDDLTNNRIAYTHNGSETTADSFVFTVSDGAGGVISDTTFAIAILPVNDAPILAVNAGLALNEGASSVLTPARLRTTDAEQSSTALTYTLSTVPSHGALVVSGATLTVNATFTQDDLDQGRVTFTHDGGETIADSFTFTVADGAGGGIGSNEFAITVNPVNDAPHFVTPAAITATEDLTYTYNVVTGDVDLGITVLTLSVIAKPDWLSFTVSGNGAGTLMGTPNNEQVGPHTVTLRVSDGALFTEQTFTLNVLNINDAPSFTSTPITTAQEGQLYQYLITASDSDPGANALSFTAFTKPSWLSFTDHGNGTATLSGTPNAAQVGPHAVYLWVQDGQAMTEQSFTITVVPAPIATPTVTPTLTATVSAIPSPTATATPISMATSTVTPTVTDTPTDTVMPTASAMATSSPTTTDTSVPTATQPMAIPTNTATPMETVTPTRTVSVTSTSTVTPSATPTPMLFHTATATSTATATPTATQTFTQVPSAAWTATTTPSVTPTPTPVYTIVIDWNLADFGVPLDDILDIHLYVRELEGLDTGGLNQIGDFFYLGRTADGTAASFTWRENASGVATQFMAGPDRDVNYEFQLWIIVREDEGGIFNGPFGQFRVNGAPHRDIPTPTATLGATATVPPVATVTPTTHVDGPTPTATVKAAFVPATDNGLRLNWILEELGVDLSRLVDIHVYIRTDFGEHIEGLNEINGYYYLGRTGSGASESFLWRKALSGIAPAFQNGPQIGRAYEFQLWCLLLNEDGESVTNEGPNQRFDVRELTLAEIPTATPTATPAMPLLPVPALMVLDSTSSLTDLSSGLDYDPLGQESLTVCWDLEGSSVNAEKVRDAHVYVCVDGDDYVYLGRTGSQEAHWLEWKKGALNLARIFRAGPAVGHTYRFRVFYLLQGTDTAIAGPYETAGEVGLLHSLCVTDDSVSLTDLCGSSDQDFASERALAVRWQFPAETLNLAELVEYHLYVKVDSGEFVYLGKAPKGTELFVWKEGSNNTHLAFRSGPQYGRMYRFRVYALTTQKPYKRMETLTGVNFLEAIPTPTATPTVGISPTPSVTPTPTVTPLPKP